MNYDILFITDPEGIMLFITDSEIYNKKSEESNVIAKYHLAEFFEISSRKEIYSYLDNHQDKLLSESSISIFDVVLNHGNKKVRLSIKPVTDKYSRKIAYAGCINAMGNGKISDFNAKDDIGFLDDLPIGIYRTNSEGNINYAGKGFLRILEFQSFDEVCGLNFLELCQNKEDIDLNSPNNLLNSLEIRLLKKNGEVIWVKNSFRFLYNHMDGKSFIEGIIEDISTQKAKELELLESEKKQKELINSKDKLFSIISHDLRSPINQFVGATELLLSRLEEYNVETIRKYLVLLNNEAVQSSRLLENLLQWSKNQRGLIKFDPKPVQLLHMVNDLLPIYQSIANSKRIKIEINISRSLYTYVDKDMVSTILRNLLSNALKFTGEGGLIFISAKKKNDNDDPRSEYIEFLVKDNGIGISSNTIPKLFNLTETSYIRDTYEDAVTGLGLIICKEFVEKHNGSIWVESEPGVGSSFYFTLY